MKKNTRKKRLTNDWLEKEPNLPGRATLLALDHVQAAFEELSNGEDSIAPLGNLSLLTHTVKKHLYCVGEQG